MCKIGIYLVCNYPDKDSFIENVKLCQRYGIDFLEIGLPFSDPVADGAIIEKASNEALKRYSADDFFESIKKSREIFDGRLYIMTYANLVFGCGIETFAQRYRFIDGVIIADVPFVESERFKAVFDKFDTGFVYFATPESSFETLKKIKQKTNDFIYFVSIRGTTGGEFSLDEDSIERLKFLKGAKHGVIVGFGIKTKEHIKTACSYADGVVIGSRAVEMAQKGQFEKFLISIKQ